MFMNVDVEIPAREIMKRMLDTHSPHYILLLLAEEYGYHSPEFFADKLSKILEGTDE